MLKKKKKLFVCLFVPTLTGCLQKRNLCESSVRDSELDFLQTQCYK